MPRLAASHISRRFAYAALIAWMAISGAYYLCGLYAMNEEFFHPEQMARGPFDFDDDRQIVTDIEGEAKAAGVAYGDSLVRINGEPYRGSAQVHSVLRQALPGDTLQFDVRDQTGREKHASIKLVHRESPGFSLAGMIFFVGTLVLVPLISLLAGYWVVAAKPNDPNAWFVLVLLTFPEVGFGNLDWTYFTGGLYVVFAIWHMATQLIVPVSFTWLGARFPERWRGDRRAPWFKWFVIGVVAVILASQLFIAYLQLYRAADVLRYATLNKTADKLANTSYIVSVLFFVLAIGDQFRTTSNPDSRRRLRVLFSGGCLSLVPLVLIFSIGPLLGFDPHHGSGYMLIMPLIVIFPLTLAYVVVVQRAMDVRLLVRLGTQYALARATLRAVQVALISLFMVWIGLPMLTRGSHKIAGTVVKLAFLGIVFRVILMSKWTGRLQRWLDHRFFREAYNTENVLRELSLQARQYTETQPLVEMLSTRIAGVLHASPLAVLLRNGDDSYHLVHAAGLASGADLGLPAESATVRHLLQTGGPAKLYREKPDRWFEQAGDQERRTLDGLQAELLLPLPGRDRLMGVMTLGPKQSEEPYSSTDLSLLQSVGAQAGLAIEISELVRSLARETAHRQLLHSELNIARDVQQRLFPKRSPEVAGLDVAGHCQPAQTVGGDYYDFLLTPNGHLGLAIGDVAGKGVPAALLMSGLQASLRALSLSGSTDLAQLMAQLNRLIYDATPANRFATFFYGLYDPATRRFCYSSAGHNPVLLLRANGEPEWLRTPGVGLGLARQSRYRQADIALHPGDCLVLYTDGVTEARTAQEEEFGEERLLATVRAVRHLPAAEQVEAILYTLTEFIQDTPQHDDITLIIARCA